MAETQLLSPERVERTLNRLAYEVVERNRGSDTVEIVGIQRRGTALAEALAVRIEDITGDARAVNELDVTPFRDDRDPDPSYEDQSVIKSDFEDRNLILVDDVLFTGRTARAALDAIVQHGRPRSIQLVILVDRGHREYPIQPDYLGRMIPTKHKERVRVDVDNGYAVYLVD
jgi:pyrimidine operon attenuation protein/uracil phosphoribosyltransferase